MKMILLDNTQLDILTPKEEIRHGADDTYSTIFSFILNNDTRDLQDIFATFSKTNISDFKITDDTGAELFSSIKYTDVDTITKKITDTGITIVIALRY